MAYEQRSGDLLLARVDSEGERLLAMTWDRRTQRTEERAVSIGRTTQGIILGVGVFPYPASDAVLLLWITDHQQLGAIVWDGQRWLDGAAGGVDSRRLLETELPVPTILPIDVTFEQVSHRPVIVWSRFASSTLRIAVQPAGRYDKASWMVQDQPTPFQYPCDVVRLAAEPGTNRIAVGLYEATMFGTATLGRDVNAAIWDGQHLTALIELDDTATALAGPGDLPVAVTWTQPGEAAIVWADEQPVGKPTHYLQEVRWHEGRGWSAPQQVPLRPALPSSINNLELVHPPASQTSWLFIVDHAYQLSAVGYDGRRWGRVQTLGSRITSTRSWPELSVTMPSN